MPASIRTSFTVELSHRSLQPEDAVQLQMVRARICGSGWLRRRELPDAVLVDNVPLTGGLERVRVCRRQAGEGARELRAVGGELFRAARHADREGADVRGVRRVWRGPGRGGQRNVRREVVSRSAMPIGSRHLGRSRCRHADHEDRNRRRSRAIPSTATSGKTFEPLVLRADRAECRSARLARFAGEAARPHGRRHGRDRLARWPTSIRRSPSRCASSASRFATAWCASG